MVVDLKAKSMTSVFVLTLVVCDFESGLCDGWRQSSDDDFDWTRLAGPTHSKKTGPFFGHGGSGTRNISHLFNVILTAKLRWPNGPGSEAPYL